ncbi:MAG TPA: SCO family protein [Candidatus Dormibacteraeota bacterium]|nr:SCO family protein [Candidatus Dormibacteraeota bacterium]
MMLGALVLAASLIPVHGFVLDARGGRTAIIRTDAVPLMLPSQTRRYRLSPHAPLAMGDGVDGFVDTSTRPWTLRDPLAAGHFVPGLPDAGRVIPVDIGSALPSALLVDQSGRLISLQRAFAGKTLLLSFVFTRCPDRDLCPAISGKFAYLQSHLDPARFALAEITLDPPYDSPRVLAEYGRTFGQNAAIWSLLTGRGSTIVRLLDAFGINSLRVSSSAFIHNDKLFIVASNGRVADVLTTAAWNPDDVIAQARSVAGLASNPFERFKLSLIAGIVTMCGGSQWAGIVMLELALFFIILLFVSGALWFVARTLWGRGT